MTIVWLRHGETALNAARVMQPADTLLSERGLAQAAAAARRLAAMAPAAILSSDLPRARQTADALAALTGLTVRTDALLQERNFGALRGRAHDSLGFNPLVMADAPPGGEAMTDFLQRVATAWALAVVQRQTLDGPLVVVSHGLVIHAALLRHAAWAGIPQLPLALANTSVSIVDAAAPHRVLMVDDTRHLNDDNSNDAQALVGG